MIQENAYAMKKKKIKGCFRITCRRLLEAAVEPDALEVSMKTILSVLLLTLFLSTSPVLSSVNAPLQYLTDVLARVWRSPFHLGYDVPLSCVMNEFPQYPGLCQPVLPLFSSTAGSGSSVSLSRRRRSSWSSYHRRVRCLRQQSLETNCASGS